MLLHLRQMVVMCYNYMVYQCGRIPSPEGSRSRRLNMVAPTAAMVAVVLLICLVIPSVMYLRNRRNYVNVVEDRLAEEQLRQAGYHSLVLRKFYTNVYTLRPGARSKVAVSLNARHQTSTNAWNTIEYSLSLYGRRSGRLVEVYQCDWTAERQRELTAFVERYNFATLPERT